MTSLQLPEAFRLSRYRFTLRPLESISLPANAGSTLRGALGYALLRQVCCRPQARCLHCDLSNECVYSYLFRTSPPEDTEVLSTLTAVARPFVIEPPPSAPKSFEAGERIVFHVVLIGRAVAYIPYFVFAFQQLGSAGLGRARSRFRLERVTDLGPRGKSVVFQATDGFLRGSSRNVDARVLERGAETLSTERLDLAFITPTRLKHHGELAWHGPPFHVLIRRLLDRVSSLSYFHCGNRWDIDFKAWIEQAKQVKATDVATTWADWERYSGRQDRRIKMGGLVGPITYTGDLGPFRGLLALGTLVHVGKGTVMGNGRFVIKELDNGLGLDTMPERAAQEN
jgi:hypothetical protein